jgi:hypothetical protein
MHLMIIFYMVFSVAYAEIKRIAVLEFRGSNVDQGLLLKLSDQSRIAASNLLPNDSYQVITRESMLQLLKDNGKDVSCMSGECEIEIGRNIGADYIITGDVLKVEEGYFITLKLHASDSGAMLRGEEVQAQSIGEAIENTKTGSVKLLVVGLNLSREDAAQNGFVDNNNDEDWDIGENEQGVVEFNSSPKGAIVLVDGDLICRTTPCSKNVPLGKRSIVVQKERYYSWQKTISVENGTKVHAEMEPKFGYLDIASEIKGVEIHLDGSKLGITPIENVQIPAGHHTLSVVDNCYVGKDYNFKVKSGKKENISKYPIKNRTAGIEVSVVDENGNNKIADIYVDGKWVGQSPLTAKIPLCSKIIEAKVNDYTVQQSLLLKEREVSFIEMGANEVLATMLIGEWALQGECFYRRIIFTDTHLYSDSDHKQFFIKVNKGSGWEDLEPVGGKRWVWWTKSNETLLLGTEGNEVFWTHFVTYISDDKMSHAYCDDDGTNCKQKAQWERCVR